MNKQIVTVTIDDIQTQVPTEWTIMNAAEQVGINIPSLCYHKELIPTGSCGICLVEAQGYRDMVRACMTPVHDGMVVRTHSRALTNLRRGILELILSNHPDDCFYCVRNGNCELQRLAKQLGIENQRIGKIYQHRESDITHVTQPPPCSPRKRGETFNGQLRCSRWVFPPLAGGLRGGSA